MRIPVQNTSPMAEDAISKKSRNRKTIYPAARVKPENPQDDTRPACQANCEDSTLKCHKWGGGILSRLCEGLCRTGCRYGDIIIRA